MEQFVCPSEDKEAQITAGSTIDHLVSIIVFLGALLLFIGLFNQTLQTAILYQSHRNLATECSNLLDSILLNPGNWSGSTPTGFGLQDPEFKQYRVSPFSPMRLLSAAGDKVRYGATGEWYSNVSWGIGGGYLLMQEGYCINYSTASKLLGTNGTYGFQLTISSTMTMNFREVQLNPLTLEVQVLGLGLPLSNTTLNYLMFWTNSTNGGSLSRGNATTDSLGLSDFVFPQISVDNNQTAYTFIVKANVGGLHGIGYASREVVTASGNIIPFVESYANGTVLLAHKWGKNDPGSNVSALNFNATFYLLPDNFSPVKVDLLNSTQQVDFNAGIPFYAVQIPISNAGFLIVTYWSGTGYGMVVMPWGIGTIGLSVVFGDNPSGKEWVATNMRQVVITDVAYQAKLALWSLKGYQVIG
jgi:hypothetical protein